MKAVMARVPLRNYRAADFEDIMDYFSDEEVSKFEDFYPMSEEQVRNIITEWKDMDNRLVAELKSQQNVIGSVGYWIDDEGHYCIDYDFNPRYCGKGYATEASNALIHYLFESVGISAIYGDCDVQNVSSWKLLERLGFKLFALFLCKGAEMFFPFLYGRRTAGGKRREMMAKLLSYEDRLEIRSG